MAFARDRRASRGIIGARLESVPMMMPSNVFLALMPPPQVCEEVEKATRELGIRMPHGGRPVPRQKYHLTLRYFGSADASVSAEIATAIQQAVASVRVAPFVLNLNVSNSVRTNRKIRWWLSPRDTPAGLTLLYDRVQAALSTAKVPTERSKFVPHVTVLKEARVSLPTTPIKSIEWAVSDFVLLRSFLAGERDGYEEIDRWPLIAPLPPKPDSRQMSLI